jgi:hypothetical protein
MLLTKLCRSAIDFEALLQAGTARGAMEEEDERDEDLPAQSTLPTQAMDTSYRGLLARAKGMPGGEAAFKSALIQEAANRLDNVITSGASDRERMKAREDALVKLHQYVSFSSLSEQSRSIHSFTKSSYLEAMYGITATGFVTGSSALHPKTSEGLHTFGPSQEVKNLVNVLLTEQRDVHAFVKTSIL